MDLLMLSAGILDVLEAFPYTRATFGTCVGSSLCQCNLHLSADYGELGYWPTGVCGSLLSMCQSHELVARSYGFHLQPTPTCLGLKALLLFFVVFGYWPTGMFVYGCHKIVMQKIRVQYISEIQVILFSLVRAHANKQFRVEAFHLLLLAI